MDGLWIFTLKFNSEPHESFWGRAEKSTKFTVGQGSASSLMLPEPEVSMMPQSFLRDESMVEHMLFLNSSPVLFYHDFSPSA